MQRRRFSSHEDAIIREEIARGRGWAQRLATRLQRHHRSVRSRAELLRERGELPVEPPQIPQSQRRGSWTPAEVIALKACIRDGLSSADTAHKLGKPRNAVSYKARTLGIRFHPRLPQTQPDWKRHEAVEMARTGAKVRHIVGELNVSKTWVHNVLREERVERPRGHWSARDDHQLRVLHAQGKTDREIAEITGRTLPAVIFRRRTLGIKRQRVYTKRDTN